MPALTVPQILITLLTMGVTYLVIDGLKDVSAWLKIDLSGYSTTIVTAVVTAILSLANLGLSLIPVAYDPTVSAFFTFLVLLLGVIGVNAQVRKLQGKPSTPTISTPPAAKK